MNTNLIPSLVWFFFTLVCAGLCFDVLYNYFVRKMDGVLFYFFIFTVLGSFALIMGIQMLHVPGLYLR